MSGNVKKIQILKYNIISKVVKIRMGNDGSRVINIDNVQDHLNCCEEIQAIDCPIYGNIHHVNYNDMQFFLGQSQSKSNPHPKALHYLLPPGLLVISQFKLLEDINPQSIEQVLQIILGICEMGIQHDIGIGYGRVAYAGRWGVVGQKPVDWGYKQIIEQENCYGVFLSPQQMISLSQNRRAAKHTSEKSDVFALGIMLIQMMFGDRELEETVFDYGNFELKLQPLLAKLLQIREEYHEYNDAIYSMFLGMLEIQEQDRFSFKQLSDFVQQIKKTYCRMTSSKMSSSNHSRGNRTPNRQSKVDQYSKTPKGRNNQQFRNDVSPLRSRFAGNARIPERLGRTPERNRARQQSSRSPLRRNLKINTQFDRESQNYGHTEMNRRILSPLSQRHHR